MKLRKKKAKGLTRPLLPEVSAKIVYSMGGGGRSRTLTLTYTGRLPDEIAKSFERDRREDRMIHLADTEDGVHTRISFPARSVLELELTMGEAEDA